MNKKRIGLFIFSFSLLLIFAILDIIFKEKKYDKIYECCKSIVYICFISCYAFYIRSKLYDKRIIRSLLIIMILLIAWNITKIVRYQTTVNDEYKNLLWYLYYIPMMFIPITYFYLFYSINYDTSTFKRIVVTIIVTLAAALSALILSNNQHELVFDLKEDYSYDYETFYFVTVSFIAIVVIMAFYVAIKGAFKSKSLVGKDLVFALIETGVIILYYILYVIGIIDKIIFLKDITCATTVYILLFNNTIIYAGILAINLEHRNVFVNSSLKLILTDKSNKIYEESKYSNKIDINVISPMDDNSSVYIDDILVTKKKISGGYIYYEKDLSSFLSLKKELEENKETLEKRIEAQRKTSEIKEEIVKRQYLNEINDKFYKNVSDIINDIKVLEDSDLEYSIKMKEICLVLIYLKRGSLFSIFQNPEELHETTDLVFALHELVEYLKKLDVNCNILFYEKKVSNENILNIYREVYSDIVIARKNGYNDIFISINKVNDKYEIRLSIEDGNIIEGLEETQILDGQTLIIRKVI